MDTVDHIIKTPNQEKSLTISKVVSIDLKNSPGKEFIYFDKQKDGTWGLGYTKGSLEEFGNDSSEYPHNKKRKPKKKK